MQVDKKQISSSALRLTNWFQSHARDLPWRANKNPYFIWISEVMLQQTTSKAVVPFFKNFLLKFPDVETLAQAREEEVLSAWAGLGYYTRAKNLHKAAQKISQLGSFPKTAQELLLLPGFGPYTSRAVSSLAFSEPVGVVDGNVIRVLSRIHAISDLWWTRQGFQTIQKLSDLYSAAGEPGTLNAGLMELGATVCRPQNPLCDECPLRLECRARIEKSQNQYPAIRPRKKIELVEWQPQIIEKSGKFALIKNEYAPFLKSSWIFPGTFRTLKQKPKQFSFSHTITHRQIFVTLGLPKKPVNSSEPQKKSSSLLWVTSSDLPKKNPSALLKKALAVWQEQSQTPKAKRNSPTQRRS